MNLLLRDNLSMGRPRKTDFSANFQLRLKLAREAAGFTQAEFAAALGVPLERYKKYENRENSLLPVDLLPLVCQLTHQEPWYFLAIKPPKDASKNNHPPN